jgi:predicted O-methyltransferase YrrM
MDSAFNKVLARYEERAKREGELFEAEDQRKLFGRRDEFLLHVGEAVARFLHALVVARKAKRLVELGSSYGYSTLFLADAARETGGVLMSFEIDAGKQHHARREIEEAGLGNQVEWHRGDASQLLKTIEGPIDFVLIDLWKELYVPCLDLIYPKLNQNAVIAADNMLEPKIFRREAEIYRSAVRAKPDIESMLLPIGQGIELSCLWRTAGDGGS